ncbi:MAG: hypothetical protein ACK5IJ_04770 [Mangrovibacterium sp.]
MDNLKIHFDDEEQVFSFIWDGKVSARDIIASAEMGAIPEGCQRVICNHMHADMIVDRKGYLEVADFFIKNKSIFENCRFAAIVDNPTTAAAYSLIIHQVNHRNYRLFSTESAALRWLKEF